MSAPPRRCPALPAPGWEPGSNAPLHKEPKTHTEKTTSKKERSPAPRVPGPAEAPGGECPRSAPAPLCPRTAPRLGCSPHPRRPARRPAPFPRPGAGGGKFCGEMEPAEPLPALPLPRPARGVRPHRAPCTHLPPRKGACAATLTFHLSPSGSGHKYLLYNKPKDRTRLFAAKVTGAKECGREGEDRGGRRKKKKKRAEHNNNILRVQMWIEIPQRCTCL